MGSVPCPLPWPPRPGNKDRPFHTRHSALTLVIQVPALHAVPSPPTPAPAPGPPPPETLGPSSLQPRPRPGRPSPATAQLSHQTGGEQVRGGGGTPLGSGYKLHLAAAAPWGVWVCRWDVTADLRAGVGQQQGTLRADGAGGEGRPRWPLPQLVQPLGLLRVGAGASIHSHTVTVPGLREQGGLSPGS